MGVNRGYLMENYRLFHSTDRRDADFLSHSHDFHKVVFCLSGKVTYTMEGTIYELRAWDILIVPEHQIHRSVMTADEVYERYILWIKDDFLKSFNESSMIKPFEIAMLEKRCLFFAHPQQRAVLLEKLISIEKHMNSALSGHALMADTYFIQFILELNSCLQSFDAETSIVRPDSRFQELLDYINTHLSEDLSVNALAERFYYSSSYLMHTFKKNTSYTLHHYVTEKRLLRAANLILSGESITSTAEVTGFTDYSTFAKSFRRFFGVAPSIWRADPSVRSNGK